MLKITLKNPNTQAEETYDVVKEFRLMSENAIEYGLINSIFSLKASEMKNENASVRLHADSDIGNGLLKIIPDNYSLYDVRVIDEELSDVREEIRDEVEANLVNEQVGVMPQLVDLTQVIGSHTGPGLIALFFVGKAEN